MIMTTKDNQKAGDVQAPKELTKFTDENWQNELLGKAIDAGFNYDGLGDWYLKSSLSTNQLLTLLCSQQAPKEGYIPNDFFNWLDAYGLGATITQQFLRDEYEKMLAAPKIDADEQVTQEIISSLAEILEKFKSCIEGGNGEIDGDAEAIARAESIIKDHTPIGVQNRATEFNRKNENLERELKILRESILLALENQNGKKR